MLDPSDEAHVKDLVDAMSLREKLGQMWQPNLCAFRPTVLKKLNLWADKRPLSDKSSQEMCLHFMAV